MFLPKTPVLASLTYQQVKNGLKKNIIQQQIIGPTLN